MKNISHRERERERLKQYESLNKSFNNLHTTLSNNMFDGMHHQDQLFHQFISSSSNSSPPPSSRQPPSTSLHQHHHNHLQQISSPFPNFDSSSSSFPTPSPPVAASSHHHHQSIQFHDLFHRPNLPSSFPHLNQAPSLPQARHLIIPKQYNDHQHSNSNTDLAVDHAHQKDVGLIRSLLPNLVERETPSSSSSLPQHLHQADDVWSNDEVVALLRVRSSSESSWFPPEFTWEHVSRKLAEIGFRRSAEKCKEKFEEESRTYFNTAFNINTYNKINISDNNNNNSYKVFGDQLEEFCHDNNIENNADDQEQDPTVDNHEHQHMEVEEAIGCEKGKALNVFEDTTAADEIEEDANYPLSPIHSQPEPTEPDQQSDPAVDRRERQQLKAKAKKRIRKQNKAYKFKIMKGLCEGFVNKMMSQQEEIHNKILEDLLKRDEENIAREEAWKRMEMERLNTEIKLIAQEQAIAGDRQAAIIEFMNKISTTTSAAASSQNQNDQCIINENIVADLLKVLPSHISDMSKALQNHAENDQVFVRSQNPSDQTPCLNLQTFSHETLETQTIPTSHIQPNIITKLPSTSNPPALPNSSTTHGNTNVSASSVEHNPKPRTKKSFKVQDPANNTAMEDYGKRWPRDEVLALINQRCSFMTSNNNNTGTDEDKEPNGSKAPLWERISLKMSELGYKRSAKRCKEKWENINKYFRKTKDNVSKKRSVDSRTCPYFLQLSHLYRQGTLIAPLDGSENQLSLGEDGNNTTGHAGEGSDQKNIVN